MLSFGLDHQNLQITLISENYGKKYGSTETIILKTIEDNWFDIKTKN